jgi:hypothetical protein
VRHGKRKAKAMTARSYDLVIVGAAAAGHKVMTEEA